MKLEKQKKCYSLNELKRINGVWEYNEEKNEYLFEMLLTKINNYSYIKVEYRVKNIEGTDIAYCERVVLGNSSRGEKYSEKIKVELEKELMAYFEKYFYTAVINVSQGGYYNFRKDDVTVATQRLNSIYEKEMEQLMTFDSKLFGKSSVYYSKKYEMIFFESEKITKELENGLVESDSFMHILKSKTQKEILIFKSNEKWYVAKAYDYENIGDFSIFPKGLDMDHFFVEPFSINYQFYLENAKIDKNNIQIKSEKMKENKKVEKMKKGKIYSVCEDGIQNCVMYVKNTGEKEEVMKIGDRNDLLLIDKEAFKQEAEFTSCDKKNMVLSEVTNQKRVETDQKVVKKGWVVAESKTHYKIEDQLTRKEKNQMFLKSHTKKTNKIWNIEHKDEKNVWYLAKKNIEKNEKIILLTEEESSAFEKIKIEKMAKNLRRLGGVFNECYREEPNAEEVNRTIEQIFSLFLKNEKLSDVMKIIREKEEYYREYKTKQDFLDLKFKKNIRRKMASLVSSEN